MQKGEIDMKLSKKTKDIIERALKTFIQAFLGSITINSFMLVKDIDGFKAVLCYNPFK